MLQKKFFNNLKSTPWWLVDNTKEPNFKKISTNIFFIDHSSIFTYLSLRRWTVKINVILSAKTLFTKTRSISKMYYPKHYIFLRWFDWIFYLNTTPKLLFTPIIYIPKIQQRTFDRNYLMWKMCNQNVFHIKLYKPDNFENIKNLPLNYSYLNKSVFNNFFEDHSEIDSYRNFFHDLNQFIFYRSSSYMRYLTIVKALPKIKLSKSRKDFRIIPMSKVKPTSTELVFNQMRPETQHTTILILIKKYFEFFFFMHIFFKKTFYEFYYLYSIQPIFIFEELGFFKKSTLENVMTPVFSLFSSFFKKLKKKRKFRKKKFKKLYLFRRLRRVFKFKVFKKKNRHDLLNVNVFKYFKNIFFNKNVTLKIPLTQKIINNSYLKFFYKRRKWSKRNKLPFFFEFQTLAVPGYKNVLQRSKKKLTMFLRNYDQKPFWKLRTARHLHWKLFFKKKTLKRQCYNQFLLKYMKKYNKMYYFYYYLITIFTKFKISWHRLKQFPIFSHQELVSTTDSIIILPLFLRQYFNWKIFKKITWKRRKKIGRWSYLKYKAFLLPWIKRKRNFPKAIKHLSPKLSLFKVYSYIDHMTGYIFLFKQFNKLILPTYEQHKTNYMIRLHVYRYKAN